MAENSNDGADAHDAPTIKGLLDELLSLRAGIVAESAADRERIDAADPAHRDSAENLLYYLALRRRDLRPLQQRLAALGLSSLGRAEGHVLATLDAVLAVLHGLAGRPWRPLPATPPDGFRQGSDRLATHTAALLGPEREERGVRIMVTMPGGCADDYALVHDLIAQGMDCARINCAHDDPATWLRIIGHVRRAAAELGRSCRIAMDLGGPKLRTGPMSSGPAVARVKPARDAYGRVTAPARLWLSDEAAPKPAPAAAQACLGVPAAWLARLCAGDEVTLCDARDAKRTMTVVDKTLHGCWVELRQTAYIASDTVLRHRAAAGEGSKKERSETERSNSAAIAPLPPRENFILLHKDDLLTVTRDATPGRAGVSDDAGKARTPGVIGCTLPAIFDDVQAGEAIWFDDGKIGGTIVEAGPDALQVRITHARPNGAKLRADKGINFPDSALRLPALTAKDIDDLAFVVKHADIVELSFANRADDVAALQEHIARLGGGAPAIVLKIETRVGFENLPDMLLTALRSPCCGVMIARGDLAVEVGFERLAEVQEEILWICEAARVPVIWATQVLETLAKRGAPSRAEVTDAAMGDRAECVMLNKGPHIIEAVRVLDSILRRMQAHQSKKQPMLRMLQLAHGLPQNDPATPR
ncbi:MAG TPA: pyruvate kinase [Duganella sp.]